MKLIDTHAHLFLEDFADDLTAVVARAKAAGVGRILLPNIDETTVAVLRRSVSNYPDFFYPMIGLHPTNVKPDWRVQLEAIRQELDCGNYLAIGEIGIDLYWDTSSRAEQTVVFEEQLKWSAEKSLPVSIHSRNATAEVLQSIRKIGSSTLRGVFHSFGGNREELEEILLLDQFMIGINGVVTFKNSGLAETLKYCPLNRVVLETDSPYLAPVPFRGKRNESCYLPYIAGKLSEIWEMSPESIAEITTRNAEKMFGFA